MSAKRAWSPRLLAATGLDERHMPALVEGTEPGGTLRAELAGRWGMGGSVVVAGGAGDNAASACGMGTVGAGAAFVSLGTSGVLFAANARLSAQSGKRRAHLLPCLARRLAPDGRDPVGDRFAQLAFRRHRQISAARLTGELGDELKAPGSVTFLPYLSGERTPHNDAAIRGSFTGLGHESRPRRR